MPYDLHTNDTPERDPYTWAFAGTYDKLPDARAAVAYAGHTQPELHHWRLYYVRRTTARGGALHSEGTYTREKTRVDS